jgi:L-aminopeptidase/D-esterase-like protein
MLSSSWSFDTGSQRMRNLITDVAGVRVGHAHDAAVATGVTAIIFDAPAVASVAIHGGGPAVRDTGLLAPEATVEAVDGFVLSGGSAFGLDAAGGAMAHLASVGRGFAVGGTHVPIVPGASVFDLAVGGAGWGSSPPWWELGRRAAANAGGLFDLGTVGGGYGATTANLKGGVGSASAVTAAGVTVGAIVIVNAMGTVTVGDTPHFWAAADEMGCEFGGRGALAHVTAQALSPAIKGDVRPLQNTTIALVATDAVMSKAALKHVAVMAHDGMARAIRPSHAALDGDLVFAASTGALGREADVRQRTEIGHLAAHCLARAIARAVFEATALPIAGALPAYRDRFQI